MLTEHQLKNWFVAVKHECEQEGVFEEAFSEHCDAFAIALCQVLNEHNMPCEIVRCEIARVKHRHRQVDESRAVSFINPLSHVMVKMTLKNRPEWPLSKVYMDAAGLDADVRWEENWPQPDEQYGASESEGKEENLFSYHPLSKKELKTLRIHQDRRDVASGHVELYNRILRKTIQPFFEANNRLKAFVKAVKVSRKECQRKNKNIF